jgi:ATP-dependent helicase/nuclease subunit A
MTSKREPIDQPVRDSIVRQTDFSHFITAGAGAGKTKSIVDRIVRLVTDPDQSKRVKMSEIVAVTFTNKAAAELRNRLRNRLLESEIRERLNPEQLDAADLALTELDAAAVGTIHSFALRVLRQYPIEAKLPIGFSLIDTSEAKRSIRALSNNILTELYKTASREELGILEKSRVTVKQMRELVNTLQEKQALFQNASIQVDGMNYFNDEIRALVADAKAWWSENKSSLSDPRDLLTTKTETALRAADAALSASPPDFKAALEPFASLSRLQGSAEDKAKYKEFKALVMKRIAWLKASSLAELELLVRKWLIIAQKRIDDALNERRDKGEIDFNDTLLLAHGLIVSDRNVREDLFGKLKVYVVDEFQDTDPLQWDIVRALVSDSSDPEGIPIPGRLIVVGDPKQSIYRFRGADLDTFEKVKTFAEQKWGADNVKHLTTNFRSRPSVLDFVHHLYNTRPGILGTNFEEMTPFSVDQTSPRVFVLEGSGTKEVNEEPAAVAATVSDVMSKAKIPLGENEDRSPEQTRPAQYSDIALLIPARTSLNEQLEVFEQSNIPYTSTDTAIVYARPAVRGLISAMRVLAGSTNGGDLWWALKSPLFGISDLEMLKHIKHTAKRWPVPIALHSLNLDIPEQGSELAVRALNQLYSIWRDLRSAQPSEVLEVLYTRTKMQEALDQLRTGRFENDCIRMVILHAKQWESTGGNGLVDYIDWLKQMEDEDTRENLPSLDNRGYDAVKISTIHAAKGLEYPVVILGGMWNVMMDKAPRISLSSSGRLEFNLNEDTASYGFESECRGRESELSEQERHRLLYVGATRAEHLLYVSNHHRGYKQTKSKEEEPTLIKCWAVLNHDAIVTAKHLGLAEGISPALGVSETSWRHAPVVAIESDLRKAEIKSAIAISQAESFIRPSDAGSRRNEDDITTPASAYGNAFHGLMEALAAVNFDKKWKLLATKATILAAEHGVSDRVEDLKADALAVLESPLIKNAANAKFVRPEVPLLIARDGKMVKGVADLVYAMDSNSDLILIDYKTNEKLTQDKIDKYTIQLSEYEIVLEKAFGRKVSGKFLLHVSAGVVEEKQV